MWGSGLFAAVCVKGWGRIEITRRVARDRHLEDGPVQPRLAADAAGMHPCGHPAGPLRHRTGDPAHLMSRQGSLRDTASGPYPKRDLRAIRESLKPIT